MFLVRLAEWVAVAAVVAGLLRARAAAPPYGKAMAAAAGQLAASAAAVAAVVFGLPFSGLPVTEASSGRIAALVVAAGIMQALLVLGAVGAWWRIVRAEILRPWPGLVILGGLVLVAAGFTLYGHVALFVGLAGLRWTREVHGWRRALGLFLALPLALLVTVEASLAIGERYEAQAAFSSSLRPPPLVSGAPGPPLSTAVDLVEPAGQVVHVAHALLRVQLVLVFLRFLLLPVGLRGMSLARRFAVTAWLMHSVPAFLSTLLLAAVAYVGYGLHQAATLRGALEASLARALGAARAGSVEQALTTLDAVSERGIVVERRGDVAVRVASTPGAGDLPEALSGRPVFPARGTDDAATGLVAGGGALYLAATERQAGGDGALEVLVPVDGRYLDGVADRLGADVELRANPRLVVGPAQVRLGSEASWIAEPLTLTGRLAGGGRRLTVSRLLLPIGDWRLAEPTGAVEAKLRMPLWAPVLALSRNPYLITSNFVALAGIVLVFVLISVAEALAVRTGRSIVRAVLEDVGRLRDAAERIGRGELEHRMKIESRDELGGLAESLNAMAANLAVQQVALVEKERLEADLVVARSIQRRMLPEVPPPCPGLDIAGVSIPSREVGGDLFCYLPFEGRRIGIAVGDVAGKSVPAALLMSNVLAMLRAEAQLASEVAASLGRINRLLLEQIEPERFVTLFYGLIDRETCELHHASAGHHPPLVVRASGGTTWLAAGGLPLGVLADATYSASTEKLSEGDVVVLYSDGIVEAEGPPGPDGEGEAFGARRLAEVATAERTRTAAEIIRALLAAVDRHAAGQPVGDDRTLLVVRVLSDGRAGAG